MDRERWVDGAWDETHPEINNGQKQICGESATMKTPQLLSSSLLYCSPVTDGQMEKTPVIKDHLSPWKQKSHWLY